MRKRHPRGWYDDEMIERELDRKEPQGPRSEPPTVQDRHTVLYDAHERPLRRQIGFTRPRVK